MASTPKRVRPTSFPDVIEVVVEIPTKSRNKYEYDEQLELVILDRFLSSSMVYPTDYGFLIGHRGRDGDPLDAMVCVSEPTFPGCVIPVKPIALFKMRDEKGEDDKVVCVPFEDPHWSGLEQLDDISPQLRTEIEHFFSIYEQPEGIDVEVQGFEDCEKALELIGEARERFASSRDRG